MGTNDNRLVPFKATHPGEILREELRERGIKQKEFAKLINVAPSHLNELIKGKRDINEELAIKLERQLGIPFQIWMNLQSNYAYDVKAIRERDAKEHDALEFEQKCSAIFNISIVYKRLGLQTLSTTQRVNKLQSLYSSDLTHSDELNSAFAGKFRHSEKVQVDEKNMIAWLVLNKIEIIQSHQACHEYSKGNANSCADEIAAMANKQEMSIEKIKSCLNNYGILYIEVPKVDKAPIDAYSTIIGAHPVISVTYRYNDMDKLAFDILHELCHIENHLSDSFKEFISMEGVDYANDPKEKEANEFAMNKLIPEDVWRNILKDGCRDLSPYSIVKTIAKKAQENDISPSIAVSRYKHDTNWYQTKSYRSPKIH